MFKNLGRFKYVFRNMTVVLGAATVVNSSSFAKSDSLIDNDISISVQKYYGETLQTKEDLKTTACCSTDTLHPLVQKCLEKVPTEILTKFYGCGNPVPLGIEGLTVLDLGSGSGRDCYIASQLVGEKGKVIGIDMTAEQLEVARKHVDTFTESLGYKQPNMTFKHGYIEKLLEAGIEENSVDLIISNCVVNLSSRKDLVLDGCYKLLRQGGEMYFSDVYCDRRLPKEVREHEVLWGECIAGALYVEDFKRMCRKVGFTDARELTCTEIEITDPKLKKITGNAKFYSITYRLFKLDLETLCEDYGQYAVYKGTIPGHEHGYALDDHHFFETNKPMLVCGNSGSMVGESWLGPHFNLVGDRSVHFGLFDCSPVTVTSGNGSTGGSCC